MPANYDVHFVNEKPDFVGICRYDWTGVRSSTRNLCPNHIYTRYVHNNKSVEEKLIIFREMVDEILSTGCDRIVVSGFPHDYITLFDVLKERSCEKIALFWHGHPMEWGDPYIRNAFTTIMNLYDDNRIKILGFVKKGFEVVFDNLGFDTHHIPNFHAVIPECASPKSTDGFSHIGIFQAYDAWYKRPYATLTATTLIPNSKLHVYGGEKKHFVQFFDMMNIELKDGHQNRVSHDRMPSVLSSMDIVLAVTFAESVPILPLESLSAGTPCLIGPTSDLFLTEYNDEMFPSADYLYNALVVPHPDDAIMIADYAIYVFNHREKVIENYIIFAEIHNAWCKKEFQKFVDLM